MDALVIRGPAKLEGSIPVSGSKNAALPLLFSGLLFDKPVRFENVPRLWDIETTLKLLGEMGTESQWDKEAGTVDLAPRILEPVAGYELVRQMRAGILALGPLVAKHGRAKVSLPGGCAIGARPVDYHLSALEKMGVEVKVDGGYIHAEVRGRLKGAEIRFPQVSVTGCENIMMAAALAEGTTTIRNAAQEPEVVELGKFLQLAGAEVEGLGTSTIKVTGGKLTPPASFRICPDRIETGTWIAIAAATRSAITITNTDAKQLESVLAVFRQMGLGIEVSDHGDEIAIKPVEKYSPVVVETEPFPGFATDMQAQLMAALCQADGVSRIKETIFENRFMHVAELRRLGAQIEILGNEAVIRGGVKLKGAPMMATDLRASASLVIAALSAEGESRVSRIYHLDRGYQKLDRKLASLGARIDRITE
ncbi:UDP-N-acetylglucosamine 1-carboxyvinyltransferase [bacterium]|nr:UDP-N-acetylglucosamine 1-carboxyvinyltransferase [bacterium]